MTIYVERGPSKKIPTSAQSLWVYTKYYDELFVNKMKLFPIRFYDPDKKQWELPLSALNLVRKNFTGLVFKGEVELTKRFNSLEEYEAYLATLSLPPGVNFDFKTQPDPHQLEFFIEMLGRDRVILGDPPGLGKTKMYLDVFEYRRQAKGYEKALFICKSKHKENMGKEIRTHTNSDYLIVDGPENKRLDIMRKYFREDIPYLLISYEMAAHHEKHLKSLARTMGFDAVILDEFTKIKNWGSYRRRKDNKPHITIQITNLIEMINPQILILGSGTPMTKDPTDLYAPLRLVGAEKRNYYHFRNHFCLVDSWGRVVGTKNREELISILSEVMIRRPKELLKLEEPRITYMPVKMTPEQARLYEAAKKGIKEQLKGTKIKGASRLALITRLRQITTDPFLVDSDIKGIKEQVLEELLEETVEEAGEKSIVYSIYREETARLRQKLSRYNPAYIDGRSKNPMEEVERLQNDPNTKILIGSLLATMESFTLTEANHIYLIDMSWLVTDNEQAIGRVQRRGQKRPVHVVVLYCENTIDERVLEILEKDASLITEVIGGAQSVKLTKEVEDYLLS